MKFFKSGFLAQNSYLGLVDGAQSEILVKSRNTCLKTGYIIGVSESMDLGKEACPIIMQVNTIIGNVLLHSIG